MRVASAILGTAFCALAACASAPATSGPQLPPELQRVLDDYTVAWEARDPTAIAALFADGRTVVPNACPPASSRADIERCYTGPGGPIDLRALDHAISGDIAYIIGEYAEEPGQPAGGKFVLTLMAHDGRWLIVADMDRGYAPRRAPPTPAP